MNLSISTCATERRLVPGGYEFAPIEGLQQCKEAGFRYVDFNLANAADGGRPLSHSDWEVWAEKMAFAVAERELLVHQVHGHWFHMCEMTSQEELDWNEEMVRRSIMAASKIGDHPWVVIHPRSVFENGVFQEEKSKKLNYEVYMRWGEIAEKCGVRIAAENLFCNEKIGYYDSAEVLMELMHQLNSDVFGVCWDFGHANRAKVDHLRSLDVVAPRLVVTHCHDNKRHADDHFIPFFGNVPWRTIMPKLKEIGYTGNLNMEVHVFYNTLPQSLRMKGLHFMREIGEELIAMYDNA